MATYKFSLNVPFRIGWLIIQDTKAKNFRSVNAFLVDMLMMKYADRLNKWSPHDERKMRETLLREDRPDGK